MTPQEYYPIFRKQTGLDEHSPPCEFEFAKAYAKHLIESISDEDFYKNIDFSRVNAERTIAFSTGCKVFKQQLLSKLGG